LQIARATEALKKDYLHEPHYYLESLAVAPDAQGQGLASKLVRPFLAQAEAQSLSVYLDTFNVSNVGLYEHYGFVCREQRNVPELGLQLWLFQYSAQ
jgi:ribosomal protein S18 acetylase RimI-like enzyme